MAQPGFRWVTPPNVLSRNIQKYGDRVMTAVLAIGKYIATQAQNDMRTNALWQDRSGNARSGLFSLAEQAASDIVIIYLSHGHTIEYGIHLELDHGGRYAIIVPTMEKNFPEIKKMLNDLLN